MADNLEDRIRALEDREGIRELRATYCFLVDGGRFDELVSQCFTEDARCDFRMADDGDGTVLMIAEGSEEVMAFMGGMVPTILGDMSHTIHNHRIVLDGDSGSGDCYFEVTALDKDTGEAVTSAGRYMDRYRKVDGKWMFSELNALILHMSPHTEGWAKQRFLASFDAITGGDS